MSEEPQFMAVNSQNQAYQKTISDAQATLSKFRDLVMSLIDTTAFPSIKAPLSSGEDRAFLWLSVTDVDGQDFIATIFEIPAEFSRYSVGDKVHVPCDAVMDWMYYEGSTLHGGFSLRYKRSLLPPEKWPEYDARLGVDQYA